MPNRVNSRIRQEKQQLIDKNLITTLTNRRTYPQILINLIPLLINLISLKTAKQHAKTLNRQNKLTSTANPQPPLTNIKTK